MAAESEAAKPKSKRIFINQVDLYHGKNIAKVSFKTKIANLHIDNNVAGSDHHNWCVYVST
jgi:hypothetical protein